MPDGTSQGVEHVRVGDHVVVGWRAPCGEAAEGAVVVGLVVAWTVGWVVGFVVGARFRISKRNSDKWGTDA